MSFSYQPDLPPETPDIWTVCDGFHPDVYGNYRTGRLPAVPASGGVAAGVVGGSVAFQYGLFYLTAGGAPGIVLIHNPTFAQNVGKVYVLDNLGVWTQRDGATNAVNAKSAVQVGNTTLLGTLGNGIFQRDATGSSNFAAVASSPTNASILAVGALNIVLALSGNSDAYATSDTNAPTTWTGGESSSGNVRITPGAFTAGVALGNDFICFKNRGVYRAQYVGGTVKWQFSLIDPEKGAWGAGSAVLCDDRVIFIGNAGAWSFDGARFERLDNGVWRALISTFLQVSASQYDYPETKLVWDAISQNVLFFHLGAIAASAALGREHSANDFFTYNVVSKKWGYQSKLSNTGTSNVIDAVFDVSSANLPLAGNFGYNTNVGFYSTTNDKVQVLTTAANVTDLPGNNYNLELRTFRLGTRNKLTTVTRCTPLWTKADGAGSDLSTATIKNITPYSSPSPQHAETAEATAVMDSTYFRADYNLARVYQSADILINCEACISGVVFDSAPAGIV